MELAVNQFNKGLLMDTHPMVLGNDTLSDALNATFVTMNGNEVVLQNDMGNRRVDNAYLPAGYEPVGIKEYGGIIYLALYNPITNKSQVGSFPSPERKINSLDDLDLGGNFEFSKFREGYNEISLNNLRCLQSDFIIIPLTKDTSLHAGDKFVVYEKSGSEIYGNKENISNFNNIMDIEKNGVVIGQKVISPKNKLYTLLLGILNSLNEFVDVTKSLVRWNTEGKIIEFNDSTSDLIKFNSGYFIAPSFNKPTPNLTKSDAELILERQTYPANTYAYKLVGPLYLKAQLNHIQSFNYNIYSLKNTEDVDLWVEAYITYNCPDNISNPISSSDDNYSTYNEGIPKFNVFDLIGESLSPESGESLFLKSFEQDLCKYDPSTNLYSVKVVKKYKLNKTEGIFKYTIGVDSGLTDKDSGKILYLNELSSVGLINLNLIGSGTVSLKTWRFLNNINTKESTITYAFEAYPQYGRSFSNFKFIFTPYNSNGSLSENDSDKIEVPALLYNGRVNLYIDWEKRGFTPRTMYKVQWSYHNGDSEGIHQKDERWFLTTELYNSCYNQSLAEGINDFGNPKKSENSEEITEYTIIEKYNKIEYTLNSNNVGYIVNTLESSDNGILSNTNKAFDINYETKLNIRINLNYSLEYNLDNYPNYISESEGELSSKINVNKDDISSEGLKPEWEIPFENAPKLESPTFTDKLSSSTTITGKITNFDLLYIKTLTNEGKIIKNGFRSFYDYLNKYKSELEAVGLMRYGGIGLHCQSRTGHRDNHYVDLYIANWETPFYHGTWDGNPDNAIRITEDNTDSHKYFKYSDVSISSAILDGFNNANSNILFLWAYYWGEDPQYFNNNGEMKGASDKNYARVWWRTSNGTWALFPKLKEKKHSIKYFIENVCHIQDYHFAYYKQASLSASDIKLFAPKEFIRTKEYSTPFIIKWTPKIAEDKKIFSIKNPSSDNKPKCTFFPEYKDKEDTGYNFNDQQCIFKIKTSDNFNNLVIIAEGNIFENIDLETLKMLDVNKELLNPNNLYIKNANSDLVEFPDDNIGMIESGNNRLLVYNKVIKGTPNERYDTYEYDDIDSRTSFDYDGVNVVTL